jgi:uncharacterized protein (TIGR00369 family)
VTDYLAVIERNQLPLGRLLGVRVVSAALERVQGEMMVREELCTLPAVMHGGAAMAFADTLGAYATLINLPDGMWTTTVESKTNFFAPAPVGSKVLGECVALHRGRRTMVWQTRITAENGRLLTLVIQTQLVFEASPSPAADEPRQPA